MGHCSAVASEALNYADPSELFARIAKADYDFAPISKPSNAQHDHHPFYEAHYKEIAYLRHDWEVRTWEAMAIKDDLKEYLAVFAFEETANMMREELELEE